MSALLFVAQRVSAVLLAAAAAIHLATILYVVRAGLTAGDVLGRTHGNAWLFAFYALFVIAVTIHAPIGLRNVVREWTRWHGMTLDVATLAFAALLLGLGLRAVVAVFVA
jgi:fumarate reductase subunit C